MIITSYISSEWHDYKFTLDTDYYSNKSRKRLVNLNFEGDNGTYWEFDYNFNSLDEFMKEYQSQEKNLFKYFFNDNNIIFDNLEFDISEQEEQEGLSTWNVYKDYPVLDSIICDYSYYHDNSYFKYYDLTDILDDDASQKNFLYYIQDLLVYTQPETCDAIIDNFVANLDISALSFNDIQKLYEAKELYILLEHYSNINIFTEDEKEYINLAVNYNSNKERIKVI